jgi:hypothetical protein
VAVPNISAVAFDDSSGEVVLSIDSTPPGEFSGKIVRAGFFGEKWELLEDDGK